MSAVLTIGALLLVGALPAHAGAITLDFEDLPNANFFGADGFNIGSFHGVLFEPNVTGLSVTRFGGFNDVAYPPHSGDVVIWTAFDDSILLTFQSPVSGFSFWYTSLTPLTAVAYGADSAILGSVTVDANTDGINGVSSRLQLSPVGIASVSIAGAAGQYVIDDLTFDLSAQETPEPGSAALAAVAITIGALFVRGAAYRRKRTL